MPSWGWVPLAIGAVAVYMCRRYPTGVGGDPFPYETGQPAWDNNDYARDFDWLGISREGYVADQAPSVGRTVHYVAYGTPGGEFPAGVCRAAIITEVGIPLGGTEPDPDQRVGVCVLNPSGLFFNRGIPHDETDKKPGSWHWPERV